MKTQLVIFSLFVILLSFVQSASLKKTSSSTKVNPSVKGMCCCQPNLPQVSVNYLVWFRRKGALCEHKVCDNDTMQTGESCRRATYNFASFTRAREFSHSLLKNERPFCCCKQTFQESGNSEFVWWNESKTTCDFEGCDTKNRLTSHAACSQNRQLTQANQFEIVESPKVSLTGDN